MENLTYTHSAEAASVIARFYDSPPMAYVHSYGCQQNVNDGERICQMVIKEYVKATLTHVDDLDDTERGAGGFGHTGVK